MSSRDAAATVFVVLLVISGLLTWWRVPWRTMRASRADQLAALDSLPADHVERARAYTDARRPAAYWSLALSMVVALLLGLTPLGARIVTACGRPFGGNWIAQALLGGLAVVLISSLVTLPISIWRESIQRRFELSTQTWGGWVVDQLKGYAVGAVLGGLVLFGFYGLVHLAPRTWWAWAAIGLAAFVTLLSFVVPVVLEPIFNKFTPMPDGDLRTELMALADRDGVPVRDVLVADASRRSKAVNAYVSGFGPTRRIVVYDTLLTEATPAEVVGVVAHELGHAKDNDVWTSTVLSALSVGAGVIGLYLIGAWNGLLTRAGVTDIGEPRAIGLLLALVAVAGFVMTPAGNYLSRQVEARADEHALALTGDAATFESMQARLSSVNLSNPDPRNFDYWWFASHPSTVQRMAVAAAWGRSRPAGQPVPDL